MCNTSILRPTLGTQKKTLTWSYVLVTRGMRLGGSCMIFFWWLGIQHDRNNETEFGKNRWWSMRRRGRSLEGAGWWGSSGKERWMTWGAEGPGTSSDGGSLGMWSPAAAPPGSNKDQSGEHMAWWRCLSVLARARHPPASYTVPPTQPLRLPHQPANAAAAIRGLAGVAASRSTRTAHKTRVASAPAVWSNCPYISNKTGVLIFIRRKKYFEKYVAKHLRSIPFKLVQEPRQTIWNAR